MILNDTPQLRRILAEALSMASVVGSGLHGARIHGVRALGGGACLSLLLVPVPDREAGQGNQEPEP
jgi:hypothetical protein